MTAILLAMAAFAAASALGCYAGRLMCIDAPVLADGPAPGDPRVPYVVAVASILGACAASRGMAPAPLGTFALLAGLLAAIWYADVARGIVPDAFTLLPLAAIGVAATLAHRPEILLAAVVTAIPFALLAALTGGRGLGWGDVKLGALGGALLGMQGAVLAFAAASLAAIIVARFRAEGGRPIAFGPYMVLAIVLPLAF